ncbi:MAG TPA: nucleotidyltransferase family protein [Pyrinomonadaceae bacterium]|nr:nucleotidyltransferase family protein [Pyrinomonadaceae bacterium]
MNLALAEKEKIIEFCKRNDIEFCAVFGSYARGEATRKSDIDLLVRFSKPIGWAVYGLADELERTLGRKVDLATENMLGKRIRESVMRDLHMIYEKTEQSRPSPAYS